MSQQTTEKNNGNISPSKGGFNGHPQDYTITGTYWTVQRLKGRGNHQYWSNLDTIQEHAREIREDERHPHNSQDGLPQPRTPHRGVRTAYSGYGTMEVPLPFTKPANLKKQVSRDNLRAADQKEGLAARFRGVWERVSGGFKRDTKDNDGANN